MPDIKKYKKPVLSNNIRKKLANIYLDDIEKLEILLKKNLNHWKK